MAGPSAFLAMLIALLCLVGTLVQSTPLAIASTAADLLNTNVTTNPTALNSFASTHMNVLEALYKVQLSSQRNLTAGSHEHLVARQTSVTAAAQPPAGWISMSPETFCKSAYMRRSPENLLASNAISFYRNWTVSLPPNPDKSEPEEFAQAMLGQDRFTCRLTDQGCKPDMDCPSVVRWLAANDGSIRNPERVRQIYFLTAILDDIFHYWSYAVSEARETTGMLGSLGSSFASTFFPQVSAVAKAKCDKQKMRHKLAFTILFNTVTVALGAGLGGLMGASIISGVGQAIAPGVKGATAQAAKTIGDAAREVRTNALSAAFTNGIWAAVREPSNAFAMRHIDADTDTCDFPMWADRRIEDDALFSVRVREITDLFSGEVARYFDGAALGTDKIVGQASALANYIDGSADGFFTPNDTMKGLLDDSAKFRTDYEEKLVAGMVGLAWRLEHCYVHCVNNPNDFCPIHEGHAVAHMEFCPEKAAKFCHAACWIPGEESHRLYPLFGAFQQSSGNSPDHWWDESGQEFAYAGDALAQAPWKLDVPAALRASYEIRDVHIGPAELGNFDLMGIKLSGITAPFMSLPVCDNPYLYTLPNYLGIQHKQMKKGGRGKELAPCACGDDYGSGTFDFYNRTLAGVAEMRCLEDKHFSAINEDIFGRYCQNQLKDDTKSIAAEWYANCNHVAARMLVRDAANVNVPLDICAAGTAHFLGRRAAGDSDALIDEEFCGMSFERNDANTPWFSKYPDLSRPNRLLLRSMKIETIRAMERCNYKDRKYRNRKWSKKMKFANDDYSCRWTGDDPDP